MLQEITTPDFNQAERQLKAYMDKLTQNPILVHDDEVIHGVLPAVAEILPYFRLAAAESVQQV